MWLQPTACHYLNFHAKKSPHIFPLIRYTRTKLWWLLKLQPPDFYIHVYTLILTSLYGFSGSADTVSIFLESILQWNRVWIALIIPQLLLISSGKQVHSVVIRHIHDEASCWLTRCFSPNSILNAPVPVARSQWLHCSCCHAIFSTFKDLLSNEKTLHMQMIFIPLQRHGT